MDKRDDLAATIRRHLEPVLDNIHADNRRATRKLIAWALVLGLVVGFVAGVLVVG